MLPFSDQDPTRRAPVVTPLLLAANIAVFLWQYHYGVNRSVKLAGLMPVELHPLTYAGFEHLFTSMFLHGGALHLMSNMLFLWVFADNVEDELGRIKFLGFYLLCGLVAGLAHALCKPFSHIPVVGASGAISGVLGAYLMLHPTDRFLRIPAWVWLLLWIGLQVFNFANSDPSNAGVAYGEHVGGFMTGIFLALCHRLRKKPGAPLNRP
jgi:membrane associated rhomboid family serine protease